MAKEFDLISKYFTRPTTNVDLGVGDDAALLRISEGCQLAVSADMSVVGTHFFASAAPEDIGWKSLAVNISDMAAMGACPKWATLSIALPEINEAWLAGFSRGFFACADAFNVALIGGDTTRGSLNMAVQIMGEVPFGQALKRSGAEVDDDIWVSGTLGRAAIALALLEQRYAIDKKWAENELETCLSSLHRPEPRIELGLALRDFAHSCIDISDGLLADLGHILAASNVGAEIYLEKIPVSIYCSKHLDEVIIQQCVLAGGDDYELCFTAPKALRAGIEKLSQNLALKLSCIGQTRTALGLQVVDLDGNVMLLNRLGYDHFG